MSYWCHRQCDLAPGKCRVSNWKYLLVTTKTVHSGLIDFLSSPCTCLVPDSFSNLCPFSQPHSPCLPFLLISYCFAVVEQLMRRKEKYQSVIFFYGSIPKALIHKITHAVSYSSYICTFHCIFLFLLSLNLFHDKSLLFGWYRSTTFLIGPIKDKKEGIKSTLIYKLVWVFTLCHCEGYHVFK